MKLQASFLLIYILVISCTNSPAQQLQQVSNQELIELMENNDLQLVDVRTPAEVQQGMIDGAQNIDYKSPDFKTNIAKLDRSKPIAVYCGAGSRSGNAGDILVELGFEEIYDLSGGFSQWKAEQHPVKLPK